MATENQQAEDAALLSEVLYRLKRESDRTADVGCVRSLADSIKEKSVAMCSVDGAEVGRPAEFNNFVRQLLLDALTAAASQPDFDVHQRSALSSDSDGRLAASFLCRLQESAASHSNGRLLFNNVQQIFTDYVSVYAPQFHSELRPLLAKLLKGLLGVTTPEPATAASSAE